MPKPLTRRQRAVLDYIVAYQRARGYGPSIRDIGRHFGIRSPNGIVTHLAQLEAKGWIERGDHTARSIRVLVGPGDTPARTPTVTTRAGRVVLGLDSAEAALTAAQALELAERLTELVLSLRSAGAASAGPRGPGPAQSTDRLAYGSRQQRRSPV
jgi:SOS-response transcriptional repressor LexA